MDATEKKNLSNSIDKFNYVEVVIINTDNKIIGGHQRVNDFISKEKFDEVIDVRVPNRKLSDKEFKELAIRLNKNRGHDDDDLLRQFFNQEDLIEWGFNEAEINTIFDISVATDFDPKSLADKFIIPPFSIFDTRQGYWQDRKKAWNRLFNSQESREDVELIAKSGQAPAIYNLRNKMRERLKREPDWDEIIKEAKAKGMHVYEGASVFDPVVAEICYSWFCPPGGNVFDPFAGGSVRGIVAAILNLNYWGIDLRKEQVEANYKQAEALKDERLNDCQWITGDSMDMDNLLPKKILYDFIFSCPPYHDLEKYSDDPADLSNMTYEQFVVIYQAIITKALTKLKPDRFACFVVGDIRDEKGFYRNFLQDTIDGFQHSGECKLYNEIILINVAGSLPVRIGRQFGRFRKVGKMHQNILVFYKGDIKKIPENFPEIAIADLPADVMEGIEQL